MSYPALEERFQFRDAITRAKKNYGSGIIVEFEHGLEDYIAALANIEKIVTPVLNASLGVNQSVKIERLTFAYDQTDVPAAKAQSIGNFVIERRAKAPFSQNRYFCSAPIKTSDHVRVLEEIERAIAG